MKIVQGTDAQRVDATGCPVTVAALYIDPRGPYPKMRDSAHGLSPASADQRALIGIRVTQGLLGARAPIGAEQDQGSGTQIDSAQCAQVCPEPPIHCGRPHPPAAWGLAAAASRMGVLS